MTTETYEFKIRMANGKLTRRRISGPWATHEAIEHFQKLYPKVRIYEVLLLLTRTETVLVVTS